VIEQVMFFSLGFLIAALLAVAVAPAFWHRAMRLSRRKLELQLPLSAREIIAARDLVRAEAALECRKLEQKAEGLNRARGHDRVELGRRAVLIARQEADLAAAAERSLNQEAELATLKHDLAQGSAELGTALMALEDASARCVQKDARIFDQTCNLSALKVLAHNQRIAFAALEQKLVQEREKVAAESARAVALFEELLSLRRDQASDRSGLKTAAERIARQEEALSAAKLKEAALESQCKDLAAKMEAAEQDRSIEHKRIRAENAKLLEALDAARAQNESLERELAALSQSLSPEPLPNTVENEELTILRQQIAEIGAAVIHRAEREFAFDSHVSAESTAAPRPRRGKKTA
jgi:hypothetical protein